MAVRGASGPRGAPVPVPVPVPVHYATRGPPRPVARASPSYGVDPGDRTRPHTTMQRTDRTQTSHSGTSCRAVPPPRETPRNRTRHNTHG